MGGGDKGRGGVNNPLSRCWGHRDKFQFNAKFHNMYGERMGANNGEDKQNFVC